MNSEEWVSFNRTDSPFLEWLLSDHPAAVRERRHRRVKFTAWRSAEHRDAWEFVHRIECDAEAPDDLRRQAAAIRVIVTRADLRVEIEDAFEDALQVLEDRRQWEIHMRVIDGSTRYTYPRCYLGPDAAGCPPLE